MIWRIESCYVKCDRFRSIDLINPFRIRQSSRHDFFLHVREGGDPVFRKVKDNRETVTILSSNLVWMIGPKGLIELKTTSEPYKSVIWQKRSRHSPNIFWSSNLTRRISWHRYDIAHLAPPCSTEIIKISKRNWYKAALLTCNKYLGGNALQKDKKFKVNFRPHTLS